MDKDIQMEAISAWSQKDNLKQALLVGMHGITELKHEEKEYYLGEFKEKVIRLLSKKQVAEDVIYPEVIQALTDQRATKMIINGSIANHFIEKYDKIAKRMNKLTTVRNDPAFKGDTGLIVISDDAVDVLDITVEERSIRLKRLGMSLPLINAVGKKVCGKCLDDIQKIDPKEVPNYKELTFLDRIGGEHCPVHEVMK